MILKEIELEDIVGSDDRGLKRSIAWDRFILFWGGWDVWEGIIV